MTTKIKLVEIIADADLSGGPKHVLGILSHIDKNKFDPYLICPAGNLSVEAKKISGVSVINIPMRSKSDITAIVLIHQTIERIRAHRDPFGPMIVHIHGLRAGFLARIWKPKRVKIVYTEHRLDADYHLANPLNEAIQKFFTGFLNRRSSRVIAVSSSVKSFLVSAGLASSDRTVVIPNGIDLDHFRSKNKKIREDNRAPIIGTIGNLNIQKGQKYLIEAMPEILRIYPHATLEIIGEGPERSDLLALSQTLEIEHNIALLGQKNNIGEYLNRWDLFVLPSIAETFGIVILEAMAAGVPVVAAKVGGIKDIVKNGDEGILVEARIPAALSRAMLKILDSPVLAAKLKRGGIERVKDFDWKKIIVELEDLYQEISM